MDLTDTSLREYFFFDLVFISLNYLFILMLLGKFEMCWEMGWEMQMLICGVFIRGNVFGEESFFVICTMALLLDV